MKFFVYVLYSQKDKRLYIGCTSDIDERIKRHNWGQVKATCHRRPLVLIDTEKFEGKTEAFNRERFLKSLWGGCEKKKILRTYLDSVSPEH